MCKQIWLSLCVCTRYTSCPFLFGSVLGTHGNWLCFFGVNVIITQHRHCCCIQRRLCIDVNDCVMLALKTVLIPYVTSAQAALKSYKEEHHSRCATALCIFSNKQRSDWLYKASSSLGTQKLFQKLIWIFSSPREEFRHCTVSAVSAHCWLWPLISIL